MPAVKNTGIKSAIYEFEEGKRGAVSEYTMTSQQGCQFTFNLIITKDKTGKKHKKKIDQYHVFAPSRMHRDPPSMLDLIPEEYRKRRGIKTGYRCIEQIRPHTTSKNALVRIMRFYSISSGP